MNNKIFSKPPLSIESQLNLLASRGVVIQDRVSAGDYLKFISYYRFCGYGIEFEDVPNGTDKGYRAGTTFEQILDCYVFDRKLRLLVIDAIERIEVAIRTVITNELALKYGSHWYLDANLFLKSYRHDELVQVIKKETLFRVHNNSVQGKKRERFINHYFEKYSHPELPAIWMVAEVLPLGTWSMIFANLVNREDQKVICEAFSIGYVVMTSWLHSMTYLRNLCAHHSKLWSKVFTLKPLVSNHYRKYLTNNSSFAAYAAILKIFLDVVSPNSNWAYHLSQLIESHPCIDVRRMGFSDNWYSDVFWV